MATTKELVTQLEEVTRRISLLESGQNIMSSAPGLPLDRWNDNGFVHRQEIKPLVRAINNGGGSSASLETRVENLEGEATTLSHDIDLLESGFSGLTSVVNTKQDLLTAGENITIENNVISAETGGSGGSIFDTYLSKFKNPGNDDSTAIYLGSNDTDNFFCYVFRLNNVKFNKNSTAGNFSFSTSFPTGYQSTGYSGGTRILDIRGYAYRPSGWEEEKCATLPGCIDDDRHVKLDGFNVEIPSGPNIYFRVLYQNDSSSDYTVSKLICGCLFSVPIPTP